MCSVETNLKNLGARGEAPWENFVHKYCMQKQPTQKKIIYVFNWNQLKNFDLPFWNQLKILEPFEHIDLDLVRECSGPC